MPKKTVFSINCEIPGELSEYVEIDSKTSLLDGDIILFLPPSLVTWRQIGTYQGKSTLDPYHSGRAISALKHWRRELSNALCAGKNVFVLLQQPYEVCVSLEENRYRHQQKWQLLHNYDFLPVDIKTTESEGKRMRLTPEGSFLQKYWGDFGSFSEYKLIVNGDAGTPLVVTGSGSKTVSVAFRWPAPGGSLVLLPYLNLYASDFFEEREEEDGTEVVSTETGRKFGHAFLNSLLEMDSHLNTGSSSTQEPDWATCKLYLLPREVGLRKELLKIERSIQNLNAKRVGLLDAISVDGSLRHLLYEQGKPLEIAVLRALRLMGFEASQYYDSESEFDVVFECNEGRLIGEVEGKDNSSIAVGKLRQLEMNIHEDFDREGVKEEAKGVLFGNAYRLHPLDSRKEFFTEKCMAAAKRRGTALVRTTDLFSVAQYLSGKNDKRFAQKCRQAILHAEGVIVEFPEVPLKNRRPTS